VTTVVDGGGSRPARADGEGGDQRRRRSWVTRCWAVRGFRRHPAVLSLQVTYNLAHHSTVGPCVRGLWWAWLLVLVSAHLVHRVQKRSAFLVNFYTTYARTFFNMLIIPGAPLSFTS
jgi:hypothetical protein